jgi:hypothetical protein
MSHTAVLNLHTQGYVPYGSVIPTYIFMSPTTLYVEDKGGHHSVFGHIPVQKEKYYIIRIKK